MGAKLLGRILGTTLGFEHGLLTFVLMFELEVGAQGFGGMHLGGEYTDYAIRGILEATGKDRWEDLVGAICWCEFDSDIAYGSKIIGIEAPEFIPHKGKFVLNRGNS